MATVAMIASDGNFTQIRVLVAGPVPPPIGGVAVFVESLLAHSFGSALRLTLFDTAKPDSSRRARWARLRYAIKTVLRFPGAVFRARADIVHIHTSSYSGFYEKSMLAVVARLLGRPVLLHIHGGGFADFYSGSSIVARTYIRGILLLSHRVIALSEQWKAFLVDRVRIPSSRVAIVPNGVAVPPLQGRPATGHLIVLMFGHLAAHKGVVEFIEAARLLSAEFPNLRFRHVGPAPSHSEASRYKAAAADLEAAGVLEWRNGVVGAERWRVLSDADLFVMPSHVEGLPLALLEAMAAGLPVIATEVGAIPEVIRHAEHGLLIPPRNAVALAEAIRELVGSPERRQALAQCGAARARTAYSFDATADRLMELYESLASRRRALPTSVSSRSV